MSSIHYCIICGREFRPAAPVVVICPACGGSPEAPATEQPQGTILMDAPQVTIPTGDTKARPQETVGAAAAGETCFCIVCGLEFYAARIDADKCHACGGPAETTEHPLDKIDLDKPQVTLTDDRPEAIASTPQGTIAVEPASISPPPGTSAVSTRTFAAETDVPDEWQIGDTILDLYEVKHIFTTGGMGLVYRVHHRRWNLDLAVKSPRASFFQAEKDKQAFIGEAEAWIELGLHPHIVTCYYVRTLGGIPRVFAEFVEGGSLKDWIDDRRLYAGGEREALERILDVAIQFAWGLGYAHEKGMVHQDVKPANALMTSDGTLKVTDFGLVKAKGYTPAYSAPEQNPKVVGQIDRRTDIWCWGVSVLEMFTGEVTWADGSIAADVLEGYLVSPPASLPRMPQGVADLLRDCFQDLTLRPPSMDAVAERLMAVYQQELGEPYPREKPDPLDLRADSLNNRAVSYLDLGREDKAVQFWQEALQVDPAHLEANFNYGYYRWHRAELLGSEYLKQMQQLESAHGQNPEYWRLLGWIYLEQGYVDEVEEILQKRGVQDEALERAHRDPNRPVIREVRRMEAHSGKVLSVAFSPDGRYALSESLGGNKMLLLWEVATGREVRRIGTFNGVYSTVLSVAFSPDGQYALSGSRDKTVRLWDLATGQEVRRMEGHTDGVESVAFSPDGRYALSGNHTVRLWDLATGREVRQLKEHSDEWGHSIAISPDWRYVLSRSYYLKSILTLWEIRFNDVHRAPYPWLARTESGDDWRIQEQFRAYLETARLAMEQRDWGGAYARLRQAQAFPGYARQRQILDTLAECSRCGGVMNGVREVWQIRLFQGHVGAVYSVAFSPDGRYALSGSWDKTVRLWDLATGQELQRMEVHTDCVESVAFSPDGHYALSGSNDYTVRLWEVATGQEVLRMGHHGGVKSVVFSPDGRYALSGDKNGVMRLWDLASGQEVKRINKYNLDIYSVAISPDGCYAISGSLGEIVLLWDLTTGQEQKIAEVFTIWTTYVKGVVFSADGRYVIWSSDGVLRVWDIVRAQEIQRIEGFGGLVHTLSPNSRYALSTRDKTLEIWDLQLGREICRLVGHNETVNSAAFSPDGRYALSGSSDGTVRLWEFDWEWDFPDPADWDEGARPYLDIFLTLHTPYGPDGLSRVGAPQWTEEDFQKLLRELGIRGYGWLRPEGVRRELEKMARERGWKGR